MSDELVVRRPAPLDGVPFLDREEAATRAGMTQRSYERLMARGLGPEEIRAGRKCWVLQSEVDRWRVDRLKHRRKSQPVMLPPRRGPGRPHKS